MLWEFWKGFHVLNAIRSTTPAWKEVTRQCMDSIWKKVLKTHVNAFKDFKILLWMKQSQDISAWETATIGHQGRRYLWPYQYWGWRIFQWGADRTEGRKKERSWGRERSATQGTKKVHNIETGRGVCCYQRSVRMLEEMDANYERPTGADRQI